ncbi:MAG: KH domain-containing protein, partial [Spirochaetaceae bacterium]
MSTIQKEYEGKTEKEAIDAAIKDLQLDRDAFDVEILESQQGGFLNRTRKVRILVHVHGDNGGQSTVSKNHNDEPEYDPGDPSDDFEYAILDFLRNLTAKMGCPMEPVMNYRDKHKIGVRLDGEYAGIIIGRKGKNLDALQVLVNVVAGRLAGNEYKVVLDTEGYRARREEQLVLLAERTADQVMKSRTSRLLEPMNPFERRIIHTALNNI